MIAPHEKRRGYLRVDLADNCNLRCLMCQAYNTVPKGRFNFLNFAAFDEHTKGQLDAWGTIQLGNTAEPTVHPRFGDFLKLIRAQTQATIHMVTNGQLLHRYARLINEIGNCLVQVSMDSITKHNYAHIRRGGNLKKVLNNLALLDVSRTSVLISCTLMKSNLPEYSQMVAFCRERGYRMSAFPMILREEGGILPAELVDESLWFDLCELKDWLGRFYGNDFGGIVWGSGPGINLADVDAFSCDAHRRDLVIDCGGRATLCSQLAVGNVLETPLESVWNSAEAEQFRGRIEQNRGPCKTCDYRERCLNPSFARLENHFSREICNMLSPETKRAIAYDRSISDAEAKDVFLKDIGRRCKVYDVSQSRGGFIARRKLYPSPGEKAGSQQPCVVRARTRDELHLAMVSGGAEEPVAKPPNGRVAAAARSMLSAAYQRYLCSPALVRSICDPPVLLLKRAVAPVLRPHPEPTDG